MTAPSICRVPPPCTAAARAVALANHVEGLGAWRLQRSGDRRLGLICAGPGWHLARRRYPQARCLRLDLAWPLPLKTIKGVVAVSALTCWAPGGGDWVPAALAEEDFSTFQFLQWYVSEQHEEERLFKGILDKISVIGLEGKGIYFLDKEIRKLAGKSEAAVG